MKVGSLFAGIGGFDLAATRVFGPDAVRWQVEIDPWARRVLTKHWPDVPKYGDIREVTGGQLGTVDVICGGFPCQDVSEAGKRAGITGDRSGLWSHCARLIGELRPRYAIVENVPGLFRRGFDRVLEDLDALGYDAEWHCIPAAAIGAPHIRDRVWILGYPAGFGRDVFPNGICYAVQRPNEIRGWVKAQWCEGGNLFELVPRHSIARMWHPEPGIQRTADGLPGGVDRLKGCGNAIVPQVAEWLFRRIQEAEAQL